MASRMAVTLVATAVLAACSSSQGPTWNGYSVGLPNGQRAFRVDCRGIFEGQDTCYSKAAEICGKQQVRPIEQVAPLADADTARDVRVLTFQCGPAPQPVQPAPQPVPVPPPAPAPKHITLEGDANFDTDKAVLRPDARARLDSLIQSARGVSFTRVTVNGYTDSRGSATHNQGLSERRAQSVAQYLHDHGLQSQRFEMHGYGASNPVATNATAAGRAQNRRVEITLE
ncbi:OmpA family protein [Paraburkholderia kururiensis]|uniref:OmpA family protein n=1 Tax=Paraburkholderia kururiensis TaxID=984307 RepID=UPI0005A755C4|nr:OmpA family protein [Paraburkholderia kururiensis]